MLIDRGKILLSAIAELGIDKAYAARKAGYDRSSLYRHISDPDLDSQILIKYGKALKYDFSKQIPDLLDELSMVEEPLANYQPLSMSEALRERDYWKDKYIALMEKYNELLHKMYQSQLP